MSDRIEVGDCVRAHDFEGSSGAKLNPDQTYRVLAVEDREQGGNALLTLVGLSGGFHLRRFTKSIMPEPDVSLDEIHAIQDAYRDVYGE